MSLMVGLTESQAELLNVLDDVAHGNYEQRHDAIKIISNMDSCSILELMLLLRRTAKQQPVGHSNTSDDKACKLHLSLERCHSSAEQISETELCSSRLCMSPQHAHAVVDKAVDFNVGKDIQDFATPRLGDLRESDQSPTAAIRAEEATDQQPMISNRLLVQLQRQERSAKDMGSLELMGQSVAVGQSTAELSLLQASHMELVPSSYGEQQAGVAPAALHSSAASSEPTYNVIGSIISADIAATDFAQHVRRISRCSSNSSASFKQFQQAGGSAMHALPLQDIASGNVGEPAAGSTADGGAVAAAAAAGPSCVFTSAGSAELEAPPCICSSYEPAQAGRLPSDSNQAKGSELRQSALTGPVHSFQLHLPADVEDEDTASELALSDVVTPTAPAAAAAARFAALYSPASSSCCTPPSSNLEPRSALPSFSNSNSPASAVQHSTPVPDKQQQQKQQQQQQASSKPRGLGRVFGAIRRSLTGKQVKDEVAAAAPGVAAATSKRPGAARAGTPASSAGGRAAAGGSAASLAVQSRLPSFTETERVRQQNITGSSVSRTAGGKSHLPGSIGESKSPYAGSASCYKPPGSVGSTVSGRTAAGEAVAAHHKSPLGKASVSAASRAAGASTPTSAVARVPSGAGGASTPAAQRATAAKPATVSPTGSAGLAWLKQHSSEHESNIGGLRTAPVSPCNSRPASVASVRSVASAAPHIGAPSRIGAGAANSTGSSHMPAFKMTKQMVDAKQQPGPPKQQRTPVSTPGNSARSAASKTSKASYMRQLSSPGDALAAAAAAAASRGGVSRLPSSVGAGVTPQGLKAGQQKQHPAPPALSPFTATAGGAAGSRRGLMAAAAAAAVSPAAGVSRQVASRIGTGAAGKCSSQLRRSRSCGSLADMLAQGGDKTHDVSEVRKMWQQRAAEHRQQQEKLHPRQQHAASPAVAAAAAGPATALNSKAGLNRIPSLGMSRIPSAAGAAPAVAAALSVAAAKPVLHGPELTDSPPLSPASGEVRLSRSRCGRASDASGASDAVLPAFPPSGAAAGGGGPAVGSSFVPGLKMQGLLQQMDDAICELQPAPPAESNSAPLAAFGSLPTAAAALPFAVASKLVAGARTTSARMAEGNNAVGADYLGQASLHRQQQLGGTDDIALNRQLF